MPPHPWEGRQPLFRLRCRTCWSEGEVHPGAGGAAYLIDWGPAPPSFSTDPVEELETQAWPAADVLPARCPSCAAGRPPELVSLASMLRS